MAKGKRIRHLCDLQELSFERRSVVVPGVPPWEKPRPATFMIGMPGRTLLGLFQIGMYVYKKKEKKA